MKLFKLLIGVGVIFAAHAVGRVMGHAKCLKNLKIKYGDDIFGDNDVIEDCIYPGVSIFIKRGMKGE